MEPYPILNPLFTMFRILVLLFCTLIFFCLSCNPDGAREREAQKNNSNAKQLGLQAESVLYAQPDSSLFLADSAIRLLAKANPNDTSIYSLSLIKANALLINGNPDSALKMLEEVRLSAAHNSDTIFHARIALKLGKIAISVNKLSLAAKYLPEAFHLFEKMQKTEDAGMAYHMYGHLLSVQANYPQSQLYLFKALAILEKTDKKSEISSICLLIGNNFNYAGDRKNELRYSRKALTAAQRAPDTAMQIAALTNLGVYYRVENTDSALYYYKKSLTLNETSEGEYSKNSIIVKYNMANLYLDKKEYSKVKEEFLKLLDVCNTAGFYDGVVRIYSGLASVNANTGNYAESVNNLNLANKIADTIGYAPLKISVMEELLDAQIMANDLKEALKITTEIQALKDSIQRQNQQEQLNEMNMVYLSEKRDLENKNLITIVKYQQTDLRNRMLLILLLVLAIAILTIALILGYRYNHQRNIAYGVLIKKLELEDRVSSIWTSDAEFTSLEMVIDNTVIPPMKLMEEIERHFRDEKPFLNPKLKIEDVSASLNIPPREISALIKNYMNLNFTGFVNQYRITESKKMMHDIRYQNYKIEAIAFESGFGTRQSFYNAFEQQIGMKPMYYVEYISKNRTINNPS